MKLMYDDEVILGNKAESKSFSIASSAKAFKILSSNLYKNKIRAIVRELACNALDAHKLNGATKPFEVKVPNTLDPRFVIRDFGPGMSEDDIMNLYTTYFMSTKNNSNDFIGALGLGSKSPFSYTETFSVVSRHEGATTVYTAMLDGGEPVIRKVHSEATEDGTTGLEITVPVKEADISRWETEIRYVLRTFNKAQPKILGSSSLEVNYFPDEDNFFTRMTQFENAGLYAIYGNIVYPLVDVPGVKAQWLLAKGRPVYIHFKLGELDITPSREELSLDEETVANICKRVNHLNSIEVEKEVEKLRTITNMRELARQFANYSARESSAIEEAGVDFDGMGITDIMSQYSGQDESLVTLISQYARVYELCREPRAKSLVVKASSRRSSKIRSWSMFGYQVNKALIIVNDCKKSVVATIKGINHAYRNDVKDLCFDAPNYLTVVDPNNNADTVIARIKLAMGDDEVKVLKSSELEEYRKLVPGYGVKREPAERRPASPNVHKITKTTHGVLVSDLRLISAEIDALSGFAIAMNREMGVRFPEGQVLWSCGMSEIKRMVSCMDIDTVYVIRPAALSKAQKNTKLKSFIDEVFKQFKSLVVKTKRNDYVYSGNKNRIAQHISTYDELELLRNKFETPNVDQQAAKKFSEFADLAINLSNTSTLKEDYNLELYIKRYKKCSNEASSKYHSTMKAIQLKHPVVCYMLMQKYSLNEAERRDIKRILEATV